MHFWVESCLAVSQSRSIHETGSGTFLVDAVRPPDLDVRRPGELAVAGVQPAHHPRARAPGHTALVRPVDIEREIEISPMFTS